MLRASGVATLLSLALADLFGSRRTVLRVAAFDTTESELSDMAAAAMMGLSSPNAAIGMAAEL